MEKEKQNEILDEILEKLNIIEDKINKIQKILENSKITDIRIFIFTVGITIFVFGLSWFINTSFNVREITTGSLLANFFGSFIAIISGLYLMRKSYRERILIMDKSSKNKR